MTETKKIAFGGGCHWCTEAVFQSLRGVQLVESGFVCAEEQYGIFSEAVIVHYHPDEITLKDLVDIHLHTHQSTSNHSLRNKYRSAVYTFCSNQGDEVQAIFSELQKDFDAELITEIIPFKSFKPVDEKFRDYYYSNPEKPFCQAFIVPKLRKLQKSYSDQLKTDKKGISTYL